MNDLSSIPVQMADAPRWLLHRNKQPFYSDGTPRRGTLDSAEDQAKFATFATAHARLNAGGFDGIGFALGPDGTGNNWQGIDLDDIDENGLTDLANSLPGYVEISPSGLGVHAIGYGEPFPSLKLKGIEAYSAGRYFTVTGRALRCSL
jgi:primase-polymerase (primpol)-like protein